MIKQELINNIKNCVTGNIKTIRFNDKHDFTNFAIINEKNTDNVTIQVFIKSGGNISKIENIKLINAQNEVILERVADTSVNTDFYYKLVLRITTKETRIFEEVI